MRMIPASPYATGSRAEKVVFDRLRSAFEGPGETGYTAFHSINIKRHARKRFGEIDFLVLCPEGIYVLEVKGAGLAVRKGFGVLPISSGKPTICVKALFGRQNQLCMV